MIDAIAWIHIHQKKLLCVRTQGKDAFYLPGGKREPGESDTQTLIREVSEELNVNLKPDTITWFNTYEADAHGHGLETQVRMPCYQAEFEGMFQPSAEIAEMAWFGSGDRDRCAPVNRLIVDDLIEKNLLV